MKKLVAAVFLSVLALTANAQGTSFRDKFIMPMTEAKGVTHFSECPSYSDTCTLWVRLPKELSAANLVYPYSDDGGYKLWAPLAVVSLTQEQADRIYRPSDVHTFISGGFFGFRLEISRRIAKRTAISITSATADSGDEYRLNSAADWLPAER